MGTIGASVATKAARRCLRLRRSFFGAHHALVDLVEPHGGPVEGLVREAFEGGPGARSAAQRHGEGRPAGLDGARPIGDVHGRRVGEGRHVFEDAQFVGHYDDLSTWPPNPARIAESTFAVNSPSPRDS